MIAMSQRIEIRKNLPSGTIILNRPEQHNPLSRDVIDSLQQALEDFQGEKYVRGIILTGSGTTFCSGSDLREIYASSQEPDAVEAWQADIDRIQLLLETILRHPKPIVVALNGDAIGLGAALVLAADLVVAHANCKMIFPEPKMGLSNCVGAAFLAFRIGTAASSPFLFSNQSLDAERAKSFGLVHHIVPADFVWAKAHEVIVDIAQGAQTSVSMTKKFVNETVGEAFFTNLSIALAQLATARTTDAAKEGLAAFVEKRQPKFE